MNWWMVILFWNPTLQIHDVRDGWGPMPYLTQEICEIRRDFTKEHTTNFMDPTLNIVECVQADNAKDAVDYLKGPSI